MRAIVGGLIGGTVGFLLRPSIPLLGQLPLTTVLTRGSNLTGLDLILKGTAEQSFNYLLIGLLLGAVAGILLSNMKRSPSKP
jgi:hypothetical protein